MPELNVKLKKTVSACLVDEAEAGWRLIFAAMFEGEAADKSTLRADTPRLFCVLRHSTDDDGQIPKYVGVVHMVGGTDDTRAG